MPMPPLDRDVAARYVRAGLANVAREFPNHPGHLVTGPDDLARPSQLHPIFFGSYDWHSSVHQHWMLVRLLRRFPDLPEAPDVHAWFDDHVTTDAAEREAAYLAERPWFERPYGWAWLLLLAAELHRHAADSDAAARWADALGPLTAKVRTHSLIWLTHTPLPQRTGLHGNSAFACVLLHDAAGTLADDELATAVHDAAERWYAEDLLAAPWLEPSASDFLSPTLVEVELRRRLLPAGTFTTWLHHYLPDPGTLAMPVAVPDRADPHGVHLDGLNLSRAWCWQRLATTLPTDDPLHDVAVEAADRHAAASLPAVLSGEFVGEHWLPTFAVLLLDDDRST